VYCGLATKQLMAACGAGQREHSALHAVLHPASVALPCVSQLSLLCVLQSCTMPADKRNSRISLLLHELSLRPAGHGSSTGGDLTVQDVCSAWRRVDTGVCASSESPQEVTTAPALSSMVQDGVVQHAAAFLRNVVQGLQSIGGHGVYLHRAWHTVLHDTRMQQVPESTERHLAVLTRVALCAATHASALHCVPLTADECGIAMREGSSLPQTVPPVGDAGAPAAPAAHVARAMRQLLRHLLWMEQTVVV